MAEKKRINPLTAGLAGAAIGAAVAAGSIALADEKNRKKVERLVDQIKKQGAKIMEIVEKETGQFKRLTSKSSKKSRGKRSKKRVE